MILAVNELGEPQREEVVGYVWCRCDHRRGERCACKHWDGSDGEAVCPGCDKWGADRLESAIKLARANEDDERAEELLALKKRWRWWRRTLKDIGDHPERPESAIDEVSKRLHAEATAGDFACEVSHRHCERCRMAFHEDDDLADCLKCLAASDGRHQLGERWCSCEHRDCKDCGAGFPFDWPVGFIVPDHSLGPMFDKHEVYGWICIQCRGPDIGAGRR